MEMSRPLRYRVTERWLRAALTEQRIQLGWSRRKVVAKTGLSLRTVERIENGPTPIRAANLSLLCDVYEVDAAKRAELVTMQLQATRVGWWDAYADVLSEVYAEHCELEDLADRIFLYAPVVFHGLVQSSRYAEYVQRVSPVHNHGLVASSFVELRTERQRRVLTLHPGIKIRYLLDESIFLRRKREPIEEQIFHLVAMERQGLPLEVRVLPEAEQLLIPDIFALFEVGERRVACFGGFLEAHTEEPDKVNAHVTILEDSWQHAVPLHLKVKEWL